MFRGAYEKARNFTWPVVISRRDFSGKCSSAIATLVVINPDGWILTAAHILNHIKRLNDSYMSLMAWREQKKRISEDPNLKPEEKRRKLKKLRVPPEDATQNFSPWWGKDGLRLVAGTLLPEADLAVAKLEPFDGSWVKEYPCFADPTCSLTPGRSLCRIGFPFHSIDPMFDESQNSFSFPPDSLPMPVFPIEGILTRFIRIPNGKKPYFIGFVETSSPGLKGQSGGPIIDTEGVVWGIQSQTSHLSLGFDPAIPGKENQREHQFINVGWAVHPETVNGFLSELKIEHRLAKV